MFRASELLKRLAASYGCYFRAWVRVTSGTQTYDYYSDDLLIDFDLTQGDASAGLTIEKTYCTCFEATFGAAAKITETSRIDLAVMFYKGDEESEWLPLGRDFLVDKLQNAERSSSVSVTAFDAMLGHQCWDAAALLWIQLTPPRNLSSGGTGAARGCWEVVSARNINAGTEFELITDVTKIKRGYVIVFGTGLGKYGHIGFADEDFDSGKSIIATYSQNQSGTAGQGQAAAFSVVSYRTSALIGAFRFKAWQTQRETRYRIVINHPTKEIADIALNEFIKAGFNTARQEQSGGKFKTVVYGNETFTVKSRAEKGINTVKARGYNAVIEEF